MFGACEAFVHMRSMVQVILFIVGSVGLT